MNTSPLDPAILAALGASPDGMTREEIALLTELSGVSGETLRKRMRVLCRPGKGQKAHIVRWDANPKIVRYPMRPVYVAGPGPNAEQPPKDPTPPHERRKQREWLAKRRTHNFVFNMGLQ